MPSDLGTDVRTLRRELSEMRLANRLRQEKLRALRLESWERLGTRDVVETISLDWITPYAELLDLTARSGDPIFTGPATYWQRRQGRNWPIYQTEQELAILRAPARLLVATNSYAQGLIEGLTSYVLGTGCTYRMARADDRDDLPEEAIDAAQDVVDRTLARNVWAGGELPGIEEELFGRSIEDGEFILAHFPRADGTTDFRVQEPEQLTQPPGANFQEYGFGVLTSRDDTQFPRMYYLQYGETPMEGEEYEPRLITHFRRNVRRGMKRGLTDFAFDSYDALHGAARLRANLGEAAAQQASIVGIRQWETGTQDDVSAFNDADADFTQSNTLTGAQENVKLRKRGGWEDVPRGFGYIPGPIAQSQPIHLQVLDNILRSGGQKWQAPPWLMSGDLNAMNYATSLTAESPFTRTVLRRQPLYCAAFRRPIWFALEHWVTTRGLRDRTGKVWQWEEIEHRLKLLVTAPSPETRNKLEEAQRAAVEIPLGVQSRQAYMQEQGRGVDQVEADNQAYQDKFGSGGAQLPVPGENGGGSGDGSDLFRSTGLRESLLESGFTGAITDKAGHKRHYLDGKEVAAAEKKDGATAPHPAFKAIEDTIAKTPGLSDEQRLDYTRAASNVLRGFPSLARDRFTKHLQSGAHFYKDPKAVSLGATDFAAKLPGLNDAQRAKVAQTRTKIENGDLVIGGAYLKASGGSLHLDGGIPGTSGGTHGSKAQSTAEVYAHEFMHAVDGVDEQISKSARWLEAYDKEIGPKSGEPQLSGYAQTKPSEGLAEFGRLVYGGLVPLDRVEREFPVASKFFKEAKLWPA